MAFFLHNLQVVNITELHNLLVPDITESLSIFIFSLMDPVIRSKIPKGVSLNCVCFSIDDVFTMSGI